MEDKLLLRAITDEDLDVFFQNQLDPVANWMAAFTSPDPSDREGFMIHWEKIRNDQAITTRAIVLNGEVIGNVGSFV